MGADLVQSIAAVAVGGGILLIVSIILIVRERWRREQERQRISDAAFEAEALALARSSGAIAPVETQRPGWEELPGTADPSLWSSASAVSGAATMMSDGNSETKPGTDSTAIDPLDSRIAEPEVPFNQLPAEVTCSAVLRQLHNAGMVEQQEGYVELHGNSRAAISLRLKGGKHCLVVPYHETELFTQRNLKRFQLLIYVGRDGRGTVLRSLEETVADQLGGLFGMQR